MTRSRWLRRCGGSADASVRLICIPYAGTGASMFNRWNPSGTLGVEVWAVQLPGRENRRTELPLRRPEPAVQALVREIQPLLDMPFAVFGHSMGALLAFEMCRLLRRSGGPAPDHLFVSAHRAPDLPPSRPAASPLPDAEFLARLAEMSGPTTSASDDPELLLLLAPTIRADFELCETYAYVEDKPLSTPLTCFAAADDPEVTLDEVTAWQRHTTEAFRLRQFSAGGHLFIREHSDDLLSAIVAEVRSTGRESRRDAPRPGRAAPG